MSSCCLKFVLQKAELRNMSPEGGKTGTLCPLLLQNTSGTGARFPEMIPDLFTVWNTFHFALPFAALSFSLGPVEPRTDIAANMGSSASE